MQAFPNRDSGRPEQRSSNQMELAAREGKKLHKSLSLCYLRSFEEELA
jgi:hypothetical protein